MRVWKMELFQDNGNFQILQLASLCYEAMKKLHKSSSGGLCYFYLE